MQNVIPFESKQARADAAAYAHARSLLERDAANGDARAQRALDVLDVHTAVDGLRSAAAGTGEKARKAQRALCEMIVGDPSLAVASDARYLEAYVRRRAAEVAADVDLERRLAALEDRGTPNVDARRAADQAEMNRRMGLDGLHLGTIRCGSVQSFGVMPRAAVRAPAAVGPFPSSPSTPSDEPVKRAELEALERQLAVANDAIAECQEALSRLEQRVSTLEQNPGGTADADKLPKSDDDARAMDARMGLGSKKPGVVRRGNVQTFGFGLE